MSSDVNYNPQNHLDARHKLITRQKKRIKIKATNDYLIEDLP